MSILLTCVIITVGGIWFNVMCYFAFRMIRNFDLSPYQGFIQDAEIDASVRHITQPESLFKVKVMVVIGTIFIVAGFLIIGWEPITRTTYSELLTATGAWIMFGVATYRYSIRVNSFFLDGKTGMLFRTWYGTVKCIKYDSIDYYGLSEGDTYTAPSVYFTCRDAVKNRKTSITFNNSTHMGDEFCEAIKQKFLNGDFVKYWIFSGITRDSIAEHSVRKYQKLIHAIPNIMPRKIPNKEDYLKSLPEGIEKS